MIAARQRIVEGAVGMVRRALDELEQASIVSLNQEDRVRLVTNLLTVLVSDRSRPSFSVTRDAPGAGHVRQARIAIVGTMRPRG